MKSKVDAEVKGCESVRMDMNELLKKSRSALKQAYIQNEEFCRLGKGLPLYSRVIKEGDAIRIETKFMPLQSHETHRHEEERKQRCPRTL